MPGIETDNKRGFWESNDIVPLHEVFLASAGSAWDDVSAFDAGRVDPEAMASFRSGVLGILEKDFSGSPIFAVKDPRICRFVSVWLEILEEFGAVPTAVLPIRHPLEVAESLRVRDDFPVEKSLLLWLRHCLEAERETRHIARSIIFYDAVLKDWRQMASKVAEELQIEWPQSASGVGEAIADFLSPGQRHYVHDLVEFDASPEIADWVKRTFAALQSLAADPADQAARDRLESVYAELQHADAVFAPLLRDQRQVNRGLATALKSRDEELIGRRGEMVSRDTEVARLTHELTLAENRIGALLGSTSWRLSLPLRLAKPLLAWGLRLPRRVAKLAYWTLTLQLGKKLRLRRDIMIVNQTRLFDPAFYLSAYPDLAGGEIDPLLHYLETGAAEGRDPNPLFDTSYYLEANPDVAAAKSNPLVHYIVSGAAEGRDPHPLFDAAYLRQGMRAAGL